MIYYDIYITAVTVSCSFALSDHSIFLILCVFYSYMVGKHHRL